jgi:hypothetical protein
VARAQFLADLLRSEDDCAAGVKTNIMSMLHADLVIGCLARNTQFSWSVLPTLKWTNDIRRPIWVAIKRTKGSDCCCPVNLRAGKGYRILRSYQDVTYRGRDHRLYHLYCSWFRDLLRIQQLNPQIDESKMYWTARCGDYRNWRRGMWIFRGNLMSLEGR